MHILQIVYVFAVCRVLILFCVSSGSGQPNSSEPSSSVWSMGRQSLSYVRDSLFPSFTKLPCKVRYRESPASKTKVVISTGDFSVKVSLDAYSRTLSYGLLYKSLTKTTNQIEIVCDELKTDREMASVQTEDLISILSLIGKYPNITSVILENIFIVSDGLGPLACKSLQHVHFLVLKNVQGSKDANEESSVVKVLVKFPAIRKLDINNCDLGISKPVNSPENNLILPFLETLCIENNRNMEDTDILLDVLGSVHMRMLWLDNSNLISMESVLNYFVTHCNPGLHTVWIENEENLENISCNVLRQTFPRLNIFCIKNIKTSERIDLSRFNVESFFPTCKVYFLDRLITPAPMQTREQETVDEFVDALEE